MQYKHYVRDSLGLYMPYISHSLMQCCTQEYSTLKSVTLIIPNASVDFFCRQQWKLTLVFKERLSVMRLPQAALQKLQWAWCKTLLSQSRSICACARVRITLLHSTYGTKTAEKLSLTFSCCTNWPTTRCFLCACTSIEWNGFFLCYWVAWFFFWCILR